MTSNEKKSGKQIAELLSQMDETERLEALTSAVLLAAQRDACRAMQSQQEAAK